MSAKKDQTIANEKEVLRVLTAIMRSENGEAKVSERCKSAEDLGKHYGLFEKPEQQPLHTRSRLILEINRTLKELK